MFPIPSELMPGSENTFASNGNHKRLSMLDGGALPSGSDVKFPGVGARGEDPFEKYCGVQEKDVVLAGTGGLLTMLSMPQGLGSGSSEQHADAFDEIAQADALKISEVLQRDFDRHRSWYFRDHCEQHRPVREQLRF